jgi:hypothetical protein
VAITYSHHFPKQIHFPWFSSLHQGPKASLTLCGEVISLELNPSAVIELVEQNQFGHRTTEIQIYGH